MWPRPYSPPPGADVGLNQSREPATPCPCDCQDDELGQMVELMAGGMGQWQASWMVWGAA